MITSQRTQKFQDGPEVMVENKYKIPVVLIGGTDDKEECLAISKGNKNIVNLCNKTSLTELIEIFNQASFIVANDTGPAHLASTTLTPMIVITGPTDPKKVKPLGGQILAIQPEITCKNCYKKAPFFFKSVAEYFC